MPVPLETDDLDRLRRVVHQLIVSPVGLQTLVPAQLRGWLSEEAIAALAGAAARSRPSGNPGNPEKEATPVGSGGLDLREAALVGFLEPLLRAHAAYRVREGRAAAALRASFGLTPRQADVALLLAHRATNAEIAGLLRISTHTARRHTEAVFAKLGVADRRQVAALLRGESLP